MVNFKETQRLVRSILDEYKSKNKIDWGYDEYYRWDCGEYDNVPYVVVNNYRIFLCELYNDNGATNIYTLEHCKSSDFVRNVIETIITNIDLCKAYHIDTYEELLQNLHLYICNKKPFFEE